MGKLACCLTIAARLCAGFPQSEYWTGKSTGSVFSTLYARSRGETYTLIDQLKQACLAVVDQRDWEGNGSTAALVERITGCGGNCRPNSFFFVSARGNRFEISGDLAGSWTEPAIEKWKGRWSVVIVSTNEGYNHTHQPVEIKRRFIPRAGKGVQVEESRRKGLVSIVEMRSDVPGSR